MEAVTENTDHLPVQCQSDVESARRRVQALAIEVGLSEKASHELALIVSELGTNAIRYGGGGRISVTAIRSGTRTGLEIRAEDHGPGIPDINLAFVDGFSTGGGLGLGLGVVARLADELDVATADSGTCFIVRKWQS